MCEEKKFYSETEKLLLCSLIEDHKDIVACKKTDGVSIRRKNEIWEKLTKMYNSHDVCPRNTKQLKKLWENIKHKARKEDTKRRFEMLSTGGGPPPNEDNNPISERVRSILPTINFEIKNPFDSVGSMKKNDDTENEQVSLDEDVDMPTAGPSHDHCYGNKQEDNEKENFPPQPKKRKPLPGTSKECAKEETNIEKENVPPKTTKRKMLTGITLKEYAREEAQLRKQKLEEVIEQQRELHKIKVEAVLQEKKYWETKTSLLKK